MRRVVTVAESTTHFAELLRLAETGEMCVITRDGKPVAALVGQELLEQMERLQAATPADGLAKLIGQWDDSEAFAEALDRVVETRSASGSPSDFE
ncbi:MAG: hypothetical protein ETSY2_48865 [Candidatus Entotheonella gemina]|uniref:Antitoxin n=1 Tax=Candidatus Entotheonella gemina TaxID=1429439 RepID=W4LA36_9BACT|nr:MAG: hypothetical protein ETSY2_48865 [Candidatus Entotheonella gemina]